MPELIGEVVKDGVVVSRQYDHSKDRYCWLHPIQLDDPKKPTIRDLKRLEKIRLKPFKGTDKDGTVVMGRKCPKCFNTIFVSNKVKLEKI